MSRADPREALVRYYRWLREHGLNDSHSGNASVRDGEAAWVTPTGCGGDTLVASDLVRCPLDGPVPEGASLDGPLHLAVYRANRAARSVLHSHGPWSIAVTLRGGGRLGDEELARLEKALAAASEPHALVVLHHHPVPVGSRWLDGVALDDAAEFLAVIDAAPRVRGVLWGHVHQVHDSTRRGVRYLGTPSTCFQFRPGTLVPEVDALGPAWRTIDLAPDGSIHTEVGWAPWDE
jgi:3',5'-cyclic AMP phosphodiesterase CpdA